MVRRPAELRLFFREFLDNFETTGAIAPSSRWAARALTRFVGIGERPQRILEVGPGTGSVTRWLIHRMRPEDRLDLVELNESFVRILQRRLAEDSRFQPAADRVRVMHMPIQELAADEPYDVIVSGLPLNNFPAALVDEILTTLQRLLAPSGVLSFFEYAAVRQARGAVSRRDDRRRLRDVGRILRHLFEAHEFRREIVLRNFPPAWIHHLRFDGSAVARSEKVATAPEA